MNWDQIAGDWQQLEGKVKQRWRKLTEDDLAVIEGRREALVSKIQERYGIDREQAERQLDAFSARL